MDSLASLALATEPPDHEKLLNRPPHGRKESLITGKMIKFITITVIAQTIIMFGLLFYGPNLIPEDIDDIQIHQNGNIYPGHKFDEDGQPLYEKVVDAYGASGHYTIVFTVFVLL